MPTIYEKLQFTATALTAAIAEAEKRGDIDRVDILLRQKTELIRMMREHIAITAGEDTDKTAA